MMRKFHRHLVIMERLGLRGGIIFRAFWHDKSVPQVKVELAIDDDMTITRGG